MKAIGRVGNIQLEKVSNENNELKVYLAFDVAGSFGKGQIILADSLVKNLQLEKDSTGKIELNLTLESSSGKMIIPEQEVLEVTIEEIEDKYGCPIRIVSKRRIE